MNLAEFFHRNNKVALAFSGGVDSAYLMHAAVEAGADITAYYVKSAFQPQFEFDDAMRLAGELGCRIKVIEADILEDDEIASNPENRCYFCKKKIFGQIMKHAEKDGYHVIIDGTNASDDADDRPGMKALSELEVLSPLRLCGLTKSEIRKLSREAGLWTWNKPSYACLATRIRKGDPITSHKLSYVEESEEYLRSLGLIDFRVRLDGDTARLEVKDSDYDRIIKYRKDINRRLAEGAGHVVLDLKER